MNQNFDASESLRLQDPIQGSFPVHLLYPLNWTTMSDGNFILYHPSGIRIVDNQTSYSQFHHNNPQNFFSPYVFNRPGGESGYFNRAVDEASLTNSVNNQNSHHSQYDYACAPNTSMASMSMNPRGTMHASGSLALPYGVHMTQSQFTHPQSDQNEVQNQNYFSLGGINHHVITQVNQLTSTMTPLHTAQEEQDCSSNTGPSHQSRNPQTATSNLQQLDSVERSRFMKYAEDNLCDLHFSYLFSRVPTRLFKRDGIPCFICKLRDEFGIVITAEDEMSGMRNKVKEACAASARDTRVLIATRAQGYNAQFSSQLPSSEHTENRAKSNKGTYSERDGPESQEERNYQTWFGDSVGKKWWRPRRKTEEDSNYLKFFCNEDSNFK